MFSKLTKTTQASPKMFWRKYIKYSSSKGYGHEISNTENQKGTNRTKIIVQHRLSNNQEALKTHTEPNFMASKKLPVNLLEQTLRDIQKIRKKNLESIKQFTRKDDQGTMDVNKFIKSLPKIEKAVESHLESLINLAKTQKTKSLFLGKETHKILDKKLKLKHGLTVTADGKVFVHVPKSIFAHGAEKEVKVAVELDTKDVVVRSKGLVLDKSRVVGALLVLKRCGEHENIATLYSFTTISPKTLGDPFKYGILMKYYPEGDLEGKVFNEEDLVLHGLQAAKGLHYMHSKGLAYRDTKPENMIIENGVVKIFDFGTVISEDSLKGRNEKEIKQGTRDREGTPSYKPPETRDWNAPMTDFEKNHPMEFIQRRDVYALGVSLVELQTEIKGNGPEERSPEVLKAVDSFIIKDSQGDTNKFIKTMLDSDPEKRPTMKQVVDFLKKQYNFHTSLSLANIDMIRSKQTKSEGGIHFCQPIIKAIKLMDSDEKANKIGEFLMSEVCTADCGFKELDMDRLTMLLNNDKVKNSPRLLKGIMYAAKMVQSNAANHISKLINLPNTNNIQPKKLEKDFNRVDGNYLKLMEIEKKPSHGLNS